MKTRQDPTHPPPRDLPPNPARYAGKCPFAAPVHLSSLRPQAPSLQKPNRYSGIKKCAKPMRTNAKANS